MNSKNILDDDGIIKRTKKIRAYLVGKYKKTTFTDEEILKETHLDMEELRDHRRQNHLISNRSNAIASFIVLYC